MPSSLTAININKHPKTQEEQQNQSLEYQESCEFLHVVLAKCLGTGCGVWLLVFWTHLPLEYPEQDVYKFITWPRVRAVNSHKHPSIGQLVSTTTRRVLVKPHSLWYLSRQPWQTNKPITCLNPTLSSQHRLVAFRNNKLENSRKQKSKSLPLSLPLWISAYHICDTEHGHMQTCAFPGETSHRRKRPVPTGARTGSRVQPCCRAYSSRPLSHLSKEHLSTQRP